MREYLLSFAESHGLFAKEDAAGNVCIRKPAAAGFECSVAVVLQAHMDMVCEKDPAKAINFQTDPIETVTEGDWIHACGTTLGADNGIGIALALECLSQIFPQDQSSVCSPWKRRPDLSVQKPLPLISSRERC